jgi:transposase
MEISVFKERKNEPEFEKKILNSTKHIKGCFERLMKQGPVIACYEAGCMGFEVQRMLEELGVCCQVVAPGLLPRKPGERIKTDRRDARKLARNLRNGEVTPIYVPSEKDEAVRDYLRMVEDIKNDLKRARQRLLSFLLRHRKLYSGGNNWTGKHERWLKSLTFNNPLLKETFDEYFYRIKELEEKLGRVEEKIEEIAVSEPYKGAVEKLKCFKGIGTLIALSLVVEIGDFRRFMKAEEFMAFLGLVPSEESSGEKRKQGGITKAGNIHLRKLLVEASWHYRYYNAVSKRLVARRRGQSASIVRYADKAGNRLNKKYTHLLFKGKKSQVAVTAVARELAGFVWGMMVGRTS